MTVSGRREDDHSVTLGEVFRLITALKEEHGNKLDAIEHQVRITNGRTTTLEGKMERVILDVRDLKNPPPQSNPSVPIMTPEGESLSIKVSPKMWVLIASAFGSMTVFAPMIAEWFKKLFGQ
jgi:hypothetical protein